MIIVKDTMVLIHLAKLSILEKSCNFFGDIIIPELVYQELKKGQKKGFPDAPVTLDLVKTGKIKIKKVMDPESIRRTHNFNIQGGEAECVALCWQEDADFLATDDDNVRKKKVLLQIDVIGTPAIILRLYQKRVINKDKIHNCIAELRKIGWFSNAVLDKVLLEV